MKKHSLFLISLLSVFIFLLSIQTGKGQFHLIGTWEGVFMEDFLAIIEFSAGDENQMEGNLKMFAGDNQIQYDRIEAIELTNSKITFYVPAKETSFEGSFNDLNTKLSGQFVFPDGSKHAIRLNRKRSGKARLEEFILLKEEKTDAEKLRTDLHFLYNSLKKHHPSLYTFTPKDSFNLLFDTINNEINSALTLENFYFQTSKLTNAVGCSHTGVKLPSKYQSFINEFGNHFPLRLFFKDGRAFYLSGILYNDSSINPGSEVLSINDKPVDQIIKRMFFYIPSEGCNTTTKYHDLNKRFNKLFYFIDHSDEFKIKFHAKGAIKYKILSAIRLADLDSAGAKGQNQNLVDFSYLNNRPLGLLKIRSFALKDMERFFFQLDSVFGDLKNTNTQNLILDIRDNSGGHPIFAAQLFSYLTDKDFVYFKMNEEIKDFEPLYNTMQPSRKRFSGKVFVLINGGCLSTTGHLISLLKFNTNAIFIGEEPGSSFSCNDFSMKVTLPNSGMVVNIPRTTFETAVSGFTFCEPFPVDYPVTIKPIDVITGKDTYVKMVKAILEE
ncbi:S41 family peptidase [Marinilabilia rubra]|uniref:Tail specific protease domain-containing protein n=1 Tax=Marinilabilia rubra TaxID=2162893 RepID=A0A2U2B9E1_9BACT|nr:S41 family peptidase [Marinilabilia rubra]PWD99688.1 hypothetical protein DDZ16_09595 [Marinilabilia rubra]